MAAGTVIMAAMFIRMPPLRASSVLLALAVSFAPGTALAQTTIKLGAAQTSVGTLPLLVAKTKGFFAAEGLVVETFDFKGGAPTVQALASGSVDVCICAGDHAVRLRARGLPAKIVAGLTERHGYALLALARSPVTNLASMKGRKLGITAPASLTDNSIRYSLKQLRLNPDRDLTLAGVGVGIAMKAAVDGGAVDAGMFTTPDVQAALAETGKYKVVHDYRTVNYTALDLIVLERWLARNDRAARGFLRAVIKAQNLIRNDPAALREALHVMYPQFGPAFLDQLVEDVPASLAVAGVVSEPGYRTMVAMLGANEPELLKILYAEVVTRAYLPAN